MSVTENPPTAGFSCSFPKISVNQITLSPKKRQPPSPETTRTAGGSDRPGAIKAPGFSPAILPTGGFTLGFGVKACSGGSPRLPPHGLDKGHKRVFVGTGMPPRPIRPTQRLTRPNRGDFLFSLSFGPRAVQSGCGRQPAKSVWLPVASQTLCLPCQKAGNLRPDTMQTAYLSSSRKGTKMVLSTRWFYVEG